jgi:hypothetical protein
MFTPFIGDLMRLHQFVYASLIAASLAGTAMAQTGVIPPRRFGFTAGVNSSTISGSDLGDNVSRRTGFAAGALLVLPVSSNIAIEPELLYSTKGIESHESDLDASLKMNYVQVPVLVRVEIPASGGTKPFVYGGPAIAFKASCNVEVSGQGTNISSGCDNLESDSEKLKTVDYGLVAGGGLLFDVGGRKFSIGARYDHSLGKISDSSDSKHRVISILATLEFPWAK